MTEATATTVETTETTEAPAVRTMESSQAFYIRTQLSVDVKTCVPALTFEDAKILCVQLAGGEANKPELRETLIAKGATDVRPQAKKKDFDAMLRDIMAKAKAAADAVDDDTPVETGVGHTATVLVRPANVGIAVAAKRMGNAGYADNALGGWTFPIQAATKAKAAVYAAELAASLRAMDLNVSVKS